MKDRWWLRYEIWIWILFADFCFVVCGSCDELPFVWLIWYCKIIDEWIEFDRIFFCIKSSITEFFLYLMYVCIHVTNGTGGIVIFIVLTDNFTCQNKKKCNTDELMKFVLHFVIKHMYKHFRLCKILIFGCRFVFFI